jgi:probable F420-dependent oxidoreductase
MRIGFCLPQFGFASAVPGSVTRFAQEAEALGADSLWVGDRLLAAVDPEIGYAGSSDLPEQFRAPMDPFTVLAAAAAVTTRPLLGTSVLNAPFYPPAVLARALTTVDVLSGGRLLAGLGLGWSPEEFRAVGVSMRERGARLDETLDILELLWTQNPAEYHGRHFELDQVHAGLKPVQRPHPPLYLGGYSPAALRRAGRRADGWLPTAVVPGFDPSRIAVAAAQVRAEAAAAGRPAPGLILRVNPQRQATVADIAGTIAVAADALAVEHAYVELMYLADDTDGAIRLAAQILDAVT